MTEDIVKLVTKLRHVDIHNHWLRQEVKEDRVRVEWTSTASMVADGLTKALVGRQFADFREAAGLLPLPMIISSDSSE